MTKRLTEKEKDERYMARCRAYEAAQQAEYDKRAVYCTTFCNKAHRLSDGKLVGHECYTLDSKVLKKEAYSGANSALDLVKSGKHKLHYDKVHSGLTQEDIS